MFIKIALVKLNESQNTTKRHGCRKGMEVIIVEGKYERLRGTVTIRPSV